MFIRRKIDRMETYISYLTEVLGWSTYTGQPASQHRCNWASNTKKTAGKIKVDQGYAESGLFGFYLQIVVDIGDTGRDEANKDLGEDQSSTMGVLYGPVATLDYCKSAWLHHKSMENQILILILSF